MFDKKVEILFSLFIAELSNVDITYETSIVQYGKVSLAKVSMFPFIKISSDICIQAVRKPGRFLMHAPPIIERFAVEVRMRGHGTRGLNH